MNEFSGDAGAQGRDAAFKPIRRGQFRLGAHARPRIDYSSTIPGRYTKDVQVPRLANNLPIRSSGGGYWSGTKYRRKRNIAPPPLYPCPSNTMRPPKACHRCRQSKRKCTRRSDRVGDACDQCLAKNLKCGSSFKNASARPLPLLPRSPSPREATPQVPNSVDVTIDVAVRLVDLYLTKLHNRPHSLFHPVTLRAQVQDGSINKALLLAICSMAARFDGDDHIRSLENSYMGESKRLLLADLERICIENVQTCILLANLYVAHLNPSSEALFFRKCSRPLQVVVGLRLTTARHCRQFTTNPRRRHWSSGNNTDRP